MWSLNAQFQIQVIPVLTLCVFTMVGRYLWREVVEGCGVGVELVGSVFDLIKSLWRSGYFAVIVGAFMGDIENFKQLNIESA